MAPETPALTPGGSSQCETHALPRPPNRSRVDCYAWLTRVEHERQGLPTHELHERVRANRRQFLRHRVDGSWGNSDELLQYASAYLADLPACASRPGDTDPTDGATASF